MKVVTNYRTLAPPTVRATTRKEFDETTPLKMSDDEEVQALVVDNGSGKSLR